MSTFIEPKYIFNDGVMQINPKYRDHNNIVETLNAIQPIPLKSEIFKNFTQYSSLFFSPKEFNPKDL